MLVTDDERQTSRTALGWAVPTLLGGRRQNVLIFVAQYFGDATRNKLQEEMLLNDPIRIEAERLLCLVLHTEPHVIHPRWQRETRLRRRTHWGKTLTRHLSGDTGQYDNRNLIHKPDAALLSGLAGVAVLWRDQLKVLNKDNRFNKRINELEHASRLPGKVPNIINFDRQAIDRLRRCSVGKDLAFALTRLQETICSPWTNADTEMFNASLDEDLKGGASAIANALLSDSKAINLNTLLEVIGTLAIAKVLYDFGWKPCVIDLWSSRAGLTFSQGDLIVTIQKGMPKSTVDKTAPYLKSVGYSARGKQPDIVLHFSSTKSDKSSYFIGDAKRNITNKEGYSYCRTAFFAILTDLIAYSHELNISLVGKEGFLSDGWHQAPKGLLFFSQMKDLSADAPVGPIIGFSSSDYFNVFSQNNNGSINSGNDNRFPNTLLDIIDAAKKEILQNSE